jgi:hypothetical protein
LKFIFINFIKILGSVVIKKLIGGAALAPMAKLEVECIAARSSLVFSFSSFFSFFLASAFQFRLVSDERSVRIRKGTEQATRSGPSVGAAHSDNRSFGLELGECN